MARNFGFDAAQNVRRRGAPRGFNPIRRATADKLQQIGQINAGRVNDINYNAARQRGEAQNARNNFVAEVARNYKTLENELEGYRNRSRQDINTRYNVYSTDINNRHMKETGIDPRNNKRVQQGESEQRRGKILTQEQSDIARNRGQAHQNYERLVGNIDPVSQTASGTGEVHQRHMNDLADKQTVLANEKQKAENEYQRLTGIDPTTGTRVGQGQIDLDVQKTLNEAMTDINKRRTDARRNYEKLVGKIDLRNGQYAGGGTIEKRLNDDLAKQKANFNAERQAALKTFSEATGLDANNNAIPGMSGGTIHQEASRIRQETLDNIAAERTAALGERQRVTGLDANGDQLRLGNNWPQGEAHEAYRKEIGEIKSNIKAALEDLKKNHEALVGPLDKNGKPQGGGKIDQDFQGLKSSAKAPFDAQTLAKKQQAETKALNDYNQARARILSEGRERMRAAHNKREATLNEARTRYETQEQGFQKREHEARTRAEQDIREGVAEARTAYDREMNRLATREADAERQTEATIRRESEEQVAHFRRDIVSFTKEEQAAQETANRNKAEMMEKALSNYNKEINRIDNLNRVFQVYTTIAIEQEVAREIEKYRQDMLEFDKKEQDAQRRYDEGVQNDMAKAKKEWEDGLKRNEQERERDLKDIDKFINGAELQAYEQAKSKEAEADKNLALEWSHIETKRGEAILQNESTMLNLQNRVLEKADDLELRQWQFQRQVLLSFFAQMTHAVTAPMSAASMATRVSI